MLCSPWERGRLNIWTLNISKRKQASPGICALVILFISLGVVFIETSIQMKNVRSVAVCGDHTL
jgi:hypothetical protein